MKITPNHINLIMINTLGEHIAAMRVANGMWHLTKKGEDRKDAISEEMLQQYIDDGRLKVVQFQTMPVEDTITLRVKLNDDVSQIIEELAARIDTHDALAARIAKLEEHFEGTDMVFVPLCVNHHIMHMNGGGEDDRSVQVVIHEGKVVGTYDIQGADNTAEPAKPIPLLIKAGPEGIPLDLIECCKTIQVVSEYGSLPIYFGRAKLGDMFAWSNKPLPADTFILARANERQVAQMTVNREYVVETFPDREVYDHLSVRYGDLCKQISQSSQSVSALERDLGAARDLYNTQCDEREALYARMTNLGQ